MSNNMCVLLKVKKQSRGQLVTLIFCDGVLNLLIQKILLPGMHEKNYSV